tara:strand:- start:184 stop:765 length:582 start_codon:yes stop_codon:yes gene_type:complete
MKKAKQKSYELGFDCCTKISKKEIEKMIAKCINHLRKKEYELNIPKLTYSMDKKVKPSQYALQCLKVYDDRSRSCAGRSLIQIGLCSSDLSKGKFKWKEYKSFNNDPTIGEIFTISPYQRLWLLVAHEVSHHVQYKYCPSVLRFKKTYKKGHGICFKTVYRYLRRDLINPMIKEQNRLEKINYEKEYNESYYI